jgi:NADPH:quinone reductase-like Zn-dependent oxidoreductase
MKAAYIERFGGPEVIKYGELPDPVPGAGEAVIDVVAASVNAADWKVRLGHYGSSKFPLVLGRDFSGVVGALGQSVADFRVGDPVFGVCEVGQEAAYAEKLAVKAAIIAKKPASLSHVQAAAVALTGLTALSAIEDTLKLQRGETILIQGGAGGVAGIAIQLAKHIGAQVITTASAANHDYVRSLGADEIVDYNKQDFTKVVRNCDAVFDTVGGEVAEKSSPC